MKSNIVQIHMRQRTRWNNQIPPPPHPSSADDKTARHVIMQYRRNLLATGQLIDF